MIGASGGGGGGERIDAVTGIGESRRSDLDLLLDLSLGQTVIGIEILLVLLLHGLGQTRLDLMGERGRAGSHRGCTHGGQLMVMLLLLVLLLLLLLCQLLLLLIQRDASVGQSRLRLLQGRVVQSGRCSRGGDRSCRRHRRGGRRRRGGSGGDGRGRRREGEEATGRVGRELRRQMIRHLVRLLLLLLAGIGRARPFDAGAD